MRLITAIIISAAGALASNHGEIAAAVEPSYNWAAAVMSETSTTAAAMVHETAAATSSVMVHEAASSVMAHETTAMAAYTASVVAPQASDGPKTHTVVVGGAAGLVYTPTQLTAAVDDVVQFVFMSQNHTVTESTFALPCNKKAVDAPDSGFQANPNNTIVPAPTWEYTVTSTEATWWYCKQRTGTHCGKGMVFAINPTAEKSFDTFKAAAISLNGTAAATTGSATATFTASEVGTVTLIASTSGVATTTVATDALATATAAPIAPGWNEGGSNCQCACFCGVGSYPAGDGIGAYGGYGGSLPAPW